LDVVREQVGQDRLGDWDGEAAEEEEAVEVRRIRFQCW